MSFSPMNGISILEKGKTFKQKILSYVLLEFEELAKLIMKDQYFSETPI